MTTNIFTAKMKEKTDQELVDTIKNSSQYQEEALRAVVVEISRRDLANSLESDQEFRAELERVSDKVELAKKTGVKNGPKEKEEESKWSWLPKTHIYDLISFYSLYFCLSIVFSLPYFGNINLRWVVLLVCLIPFWQLNLILTKHLKRFYYFHSRGVYAIAGTFILFFYGYIQDDDTEVFVLWLFVFAFFYVTSGLLSLLPYFLRIKWLSAKKYYFLNRIRVFIPFALILILGSIIMHEGWFKSDQYLKWDDKNPLTSEDFRGYPDFYTEFDAAIHSFLDSEFDDEGKLKFLDATCNTKYTWLNPWHRDSYFLLQHEQYHFDLTEVVARMARKKIYDTLRQGSDRSGVEKLIKDFQLKRNRLQRRYDEETDHSTITIQQGYWQYHIDSLLFELEPYWDSSIFQEQDTVGAIGYFRNFKISDNEEAHPMHRLMPSEEKYTSHYRFKKNEKGELAEIVYYKYGKPAVDLYLEVSKIDISSDRGVTAWRFYDAEDQPMKSERGYHKRLVERSGQKVVISYYDESDELVPDKNGVAKVVGLLDSEGRKKSETYFNVKGDQIASKGGRYRIRYRYNGREVFASQLKNFDEDGSKLEDSKGVHEGIRKYDKDGALVYVANLDKNRKYVYQNGYAIKKYTYDELGNYVGLEFLDENENPIENLDGISKFTWSIDRYGNDNRKSTYNSNGVLKEINDVATFYKKYDSAGNMISWADYGSGDDLAFDGSNYGKVKYNHDRQGRRIQITNFNGYDFPVSPDRASPIQTMSYDTIKRVVKTKYFDRLMEPDTADNGVAHYVQYYDEQSENVIETRFFESSGKLKAETQGVAVFKYKYDRSGNKLEARFYTENERLAYANQGASINRYTYDDKNRMVERSYYDSLDQLHLFEGSARIRWKYDDRGNDIETSYFGPDDELLDSGVAILRKEFDSRNNLLSQFKYDRGEKEVKGSIAFIKNEFDDHDNHLSQSYYHLDKSPDVNDEGIHRYEYKYGNGLLVEKVSLDKSLSLVLDSSGIARMEISLDKRGNTIEKRYFGSDGLPTNDTAGISVIRYDYDLYDRHVREEFLDSAMNKAYRYGSYSTIIYDRDRAGNTLREIYYDPHGKLAENSKGYALIVTNYNRNGFVSDQSYTIEEAREYLNSSESLKGLVEYKETN